MSRENVEIVRRLHPGGGTDLVALLHGEAAITNVLSSVAPFLEPDFTLDSVMLGQRVRYPGLAGFRQAWLDWLAPWSSYYDELEETVDLGDRVMLVEHHRGRPRGADGRRQSPATAQTLALAVRQSRHASALASPARGEALDVPAAEPRSAAGGQRHPRARPAARAREPALGLSAVQGTAGERVR